MLHENKTLFTKLILQCSNYYSIQPDIIERDYYFFIFLRELYSINKNIIFKGGTSLSRCAKIISRQSVDIDVNIYFDISATQSIRKNLKKDILETINNLNLVLTNEDQIRSRRDFNRYIIEYKSVSELLHFSIITLETSAISKSYPIVESSYSCLIYDYLLECNLFDENKFDIKPFIIKMQSLERTFIDKVFAICDYYISKNNTRNSRHIYDLYKIFDSLTIDDNFFELIKEIRSIRQSNTRCYSAQDDININTILQSIIDEKTFESDYNNVLTGLLFEDVPYETAITVINKIINLNIF